MDEAGGSGDVIAVVLTRPEDVVETVGDVGPAPVAEVPVIVVLGGAPGAPPRPSSSGLGNVSGRGEWLEADAGVLQCEWVVCRSGAGKALRQPYRGGLGTRGIKTGAESPAEAKDSGQD